MRSGFIPASFFSLFLFWFPDGKYFAKFRDGARYWYEWYRRLGSQKTKLIRYQVGDTIHTSIWRRHETWQNILHQETKIEKD